MANMAESASTWLNERLTSASTLCDARPLNKRQIDLCTWGHSNLRGSKRRPDAFVILDTQPNGMDAWV